MASYIYKMKWNGVTSRDLGVVCDVRFDGNVGENESFLSRESIFTETYRGTRRHVYDYRHTDVLTPSITLLKEDFEPFTYEENRKILSWLTGKQTPGLLEVYEEVNVVKYCLFGNFTEIQ